MAMTIVLGRCRLKSILREKNMTQTELGRFLDMTPQRISDYCNDRFKMSLEIAINISSILNVPVDSLYERKIIRQ
jgi:DNA-binding XRE family transcriptional regulator